MLEKVASNSFDVIRRGFADQRQNRRWRKVSLRWWNLVTAALILQFILTETVAGRSVPQLGPVSCQLFGVFFGSLFTSGFFRPRPHLIKQIYPRFRSPPDIHFGFSPNCFEQGHVRKYSVLFYQIKLLVRALTWFLTMRCSQAMRSQQY